MKKKLFFVLPALVGMLMVGCTQTKNNNQGGGGDNPGGGDVTPEKKSYTITFNDENGNLLESKKWEEGTVPSYSYAGPSDTDEWDYTVQGWATSLGGQVITIPAVSADATYYAVVNKVKQSYTVSFYNENNQLIIASSFNYGVQPSCSYAGPNDTDEWDYTFDGWSLTQGGAVLGSLPLVTQNASYYAIVSKVKKSYDISFYNEKGQPIKTDHLEYGAIPSCVYNGPEDTSEWDYSFTGWATTSGGTPLASLPAVTGNASYYAIIATNKQHYEITFIDEEGNQLAKIDYTYGAKPSYSYTKADTQEWDYTVLGWSLTPGGDLIEGGFPVVTGAATYYAIVSQVKQRYTITFNSTGGSSVSSITEDYGTSISKPSNPSRDGFRFTGWSRNADGSDAITWPFTLTKNETFYANWNEKVDIKAYLQSLMSVLDQDPYAYIPDTMKPENSANHIQNPSSIEYDFNSFTNVSNITYGGYGEQWHMVIENIKESERFYNVLTLGETLINTSVVLFNNYLDNNPEDTASHTLRETEYTAKLDFADGVLSYTIQYKTGWTIPFFGDVLPQIDMKYTLATSEKSVRIQLSENNAMKYTVSDGVYKFFLKYGVETVSRTAYCEMADLENGVVEGHVYEYVQFKNKDLVPAVADFYINPTYTTVAGNKASGLVGFKGYINELYLTNQAKLLGYEVRETLTIVGISGQYNTLWFNLNNISGINNVKAVENENYGGTYSNKNPHDIYLNNSTSVFEPTYNTKPLIGNTSRKYDVELRKQFFYGFNQGELTEYEVQLPMMFIQADNNKDTNYSDFHNDILSKSGIDANVNLSSIYVNKIQSDYEIYIDILIENKENITSEFIETNIGNAIVIE